VGRSSVALLATAATLALAACGSSDDDAGGTTASAGGGGGERKVTLVTGVKGDEFYITMACGAQSEADRLGVQLDVQSPDEFDPSKQTPIVNAVAAAKPDALLIAPTDQAALYAPIKQIADAGTKVVLVDTTLENSDVAVSQIATDNYEGGKAAARALADLIGGSGKVLLLGFRAGVSTDDLRSRGFRDGAEELGLELVGTEYSDNKPEKAASIVKAALARDPELRGVFATNSFASEGAATGLREADAQDDVKIVGFDAGPIQVEQLEEGLVQALIAQQSAEIGRLGVQQAVAALDGRAVQERIGTGSTTITQENMDSPESRAAMDKRDC
jgi:ribose transport system substrate-binding protein